jgi:methionine aminotransferase
MVSKFPQMGSSIFSEMSQLAAHYQAINLSQGFPDFSIDDRLKMHLAQAAQSHFHQYVPMAGYGPLLERLATLSTIWSPD